MNNPFDFQGVGRHAQMVPMPRLASVSDGSGKRNNLNAGKIPSL